MRACVLALVPIALAQPAQARSHSHHHATHHFSRHHHYAEHHRHHHYRSHAPRYDAWGRDEAMRQSAPLAFARTDATDSPWQPNYTQSSSARMPRTARRRGTQQPLPEPSLSEPALSVPSLSQQSLSQQSLSQQSWSQDGWQQRDAAQTSPGFAQPSEIPGFTTRLARRSSARASHSALDAMIERHAAANGVPVALVHRVVTRESGYNPRASNRGALGLMQIKYATARGVGYSGSASGLFDAETNLTYAVRYLAGAYKAAGGNANRTVALYASGYYRRGSAIAARRERPATVAQQPASNWGGQQWDIQTERVAMRDTDMTAARVNQGYRGRHRR